VTVRSAQSVEPNDYLIGDKIVVTLYYADASYDGVTSETFYFEVPECFEADVMATVHRALCEQGVRLAGSRVNVADVEVAWLDGVAVSG
jgi:hypothetical protein